MKNDHLDIHNAKINYFSVSNSYCKAGNIFGMKFLQFLKMNDQLQNLVPKNSVLFKLETASAKILTNDLSTKYTYHENFQLYDTQLQKDGTENTVYAVYLAVILIWRLGDFSSVHQI